MKVPASVTIEEAVLEDAKHFAKREGRTLSNYFNVAVDTINREKKAYYEKEDKKKLLPRPGTQSVLATGKRKPLRRRLQEKAGEKDF